MSVTINGSGGLTFNDGTSQNTAALPGMRNRIINGDMRIDQRNNGAVVTTANVYSLDRWASGATQNGKFNVQQNAGAVTPPAGFTNYLGVTSTSAYSVLTGDTFLMGQNIEGFNVADLGFGTASAKTVTLSFWVRSSLTGTFGGSFINSASNRSYLFSYSIPSANTWTKISVTVPGDTSGTWLTNNGSGLYLRFGLGSGATFSGTAGSWLAGNIVQPTGNVSVVGTNGATWYVTGVQLERGTVATDFEYRQYGTELALCQRYYTKITSFITNGQLGVGISASSTGAWVQLTPAPVALRATPTINFASLNVSDNVNYNLAVSALAASAQTLTGGGASFTHAGGATQYRPAILNTSASTGYIDYSAEL